MSRSAAPSSDVTMPIRRGSTGQRTFARRVEQALGLQPRLELLERGLAARRARAARACRRQLILALASYTLTRPRATTRRPSSGLNFSCRSGGSEHHRANLRVVVLQREVDVAGAPLAGSSRSRLRRETATNRVSSACLMRRVSSLTRQDLRAPPRSSAPPRPRRLCVLEGEVDQIAHREPAAPRDGASVFDLLRREAEALDRGSRGRSLRRP